MWIDRLTASRTLEAASLTAQFAEKRQRMLAENLANIDTPDYHSQRLDPGVFQASLRGALERARETRSSELELRGSAQVKTDAAGQLQVEPVREPAANILFHDGTNVRMESLMSEVASNALTYDMAMNLLRSRLDGLLRAIRGRST